MTAHRNQTQNQGFSRDEVVYCSEGRWAREINQNTAEHAAKNGHTKQGRYQSVNYSTERVNLNRSLTKGVYHNISIYLASWQLATE